MSASRNRSAASFIDMCTLTWRSQTLALRTHLSKDWASRLLGENAAACGGGPGRNLDPLPPLFLRREELRPAALGSEAGLGSYFSSGPLTCRYRSASLQL